ncbi:protein ITPRID1 [Boleophthalmus pectinirostris]|uniref:protein ITPRID1 n=1 Tax=Boleophthalmus pectinirostris TaxID=150288 RepID=UPI0024324924|nr:protein ITPRID1 [Boleophthalmus pectinirostris]
MDLLWNDDPEELLLELGFGCDEPDLSGRIPARFINYQSQARGINLNVFLEAQKSRIDLENPDVSNRFRQVEVLQQVSVAFSSLAGPHKGPYSRDMSPEARERRRRMGMLFRRASKKSLSQLPGPIPQELTVATAMTMPGVLPKALEPTYSPEDRKVPFKRVKLQDTLSLSPFVEEEGEEAEAQGDTTSTGYTPEGEPRTIRERFLDRVLQRKRSLQMRESFEMEELGSFDESSAVGQDPAGTHFARGLIRVNSCQSDSSGFLEDPLIPALPQDTSPAPDLLKALSALSGGSTDSHPGDMPTQTSLCSPTASDHMPDLLPGPGSPEASDQLQVPTSTLDSDSASKLQTSQQVPHGNEQDVYLETDIEWQEESQDIVIVEREEESFHKDSDNEKNVVEDVLGPEELCPKVSELIEVESLDDVFETSVDSSEVDSGDVETFFEELDSFGQVYWAEPVQVVDLSPLSESLEDLDTIEELAREPNLDFLPSARKSSLPNDRTFRDSIKSNIEDKSSSMPLIDLEDKSSKRSISIQMLSSSSSHIVHRKDIPYVDNPKHAALPRRFKLDTTNAFRAVQSWTDLHIQYKPNVMKFRQVSTSAGASLNRPSESYWPSHPVRAHEWQSDDCLHRTSKEESRGFSRDMGMWTEGEDEEVDRAGGQGRGQTCTSEHKCNCRKQGCQQHMLSQRELEELLLHLHRFCSVLGLVEEHLTEEQTVVYSALSHQDRERVAELLRLRQAVRQEALELEKQLCDLVHHDDRSLTQNMLLLLDEQSHLCSQLRLSSSGPEEAHRRTVATQCSLQNGPRQPYSEAPGSLPLQQTPSHLALGCAPAKSDKLPLVGFLHRLTHSIRH